MTGAALIVVDDDESIRDALRDYLSRHDFDVRTANGGGELDSALAQRPADLIILDLMMPGESGLSICRRLADNGPPILFLSAMGEGTDRIVGLEMGAADYLVKPFDPRELLARIRAILRTKSQSQIGVAINGQRTLYFSGWRIDCDEQTLISPKGHSVPLTAGEFAVLQAFATRPGRLLSRDTLLQLARGDDNDSFDRAIDLAVSRLRRKLSAHGGAALIQTVRGAGYRLVPDKRMDAI